MTDVRSSALADDVESAGTVRKLVSREPTGLQPQGFSAINGPEPPSSPTRRLQASAVVTLVTERSTDPTGRFPMLEHLRDEVDHVYLLKSVPGVGQVQAERLRHDFGIYTLENRAHDGRLANVAGIGPKRVAGIRSAALAGRLPTIAPRRLNPTGESSLPILHTERGNHHYTAMYSNTT